MKNLYLISLFLFTILFSSCSSELNDDTLDEVISVNSEDWDHIQLPTTDSAKVFGKYNALGYGYNVTGAYSNENSVTLQIIDVEKLKAATTNVFEETNVLSAEYKEHFGKDAAQYSKRISNRITVTAPFQLFGKTIPFSSATFNNKKYDPSFIYGDYTQMIQQKRFRMFTIPAQLSNYLTTDFLNDVENKTAKQIVDKYGTHVATDIYTGCVLNLFFQAKTTNPDREYAASIGVKTFQNSNANPLDIEASKKNYDKKLFYRTRGGDKNLAMAGIYILRNGVPTINFSNWISSSTPENSVLVNFGSDGLVVLYDLIKNPVKKAELKTYIDQYINDNQVSF